jgi:hypothetical protein
LTPTEKFKLFKAGTYLNGGFVGINLILILGTVNAQIPVPIDILFLTGAACAAWYACEDGAEYVMKKYNLDKKGNPKRKDDGQSQS